MLNFDVGPAAQAHAGDPRPHRQRRRRRRRTSISATSARSRPTARSRSYGSDVPDHVVICTHADNTPARGGAGVRRHAHRRRAAAVVNEAKAKNRRITIEDKLVEPRQGAAVIGAKTLATLTLLRRRRRRRVAFGVLRARATGEPRLRRRCFFVGCFAVVVGTLVFRFWRLGEPSQHYFRWVERRAALESAERGALRRRRAAAHHARRQPRRGVRPRPARCIASCASPSRCCSRSAASTRAPSGCSAASASDRPAPRASYCPEPDAAQAPSDDPNAPGCELMRRAYALGYAKSLGAVRGAARATPRSSADLHAPAARRAGAALRLAPPRRHRG